MNLITRSTSNTLVFTLTENVTLANPYFLFELRCTENNQLFYFIAANTSSYTDRYDKFTVTEVESGSEDLTNGSVNLPYISEYEYRVWEQASSTNLNPLHTTPLETGLIRVLENPATINKYSGNSNAFSQYKFPV